MSLRDNVIRHAAIRRMEKRGLSLAPVAVGLQLPGAIGEGVRRYEDTVRALNAASGQQIDESVAAKHAAFRSPAGTAEAQPSAGVNPRGWDPQSMVNAHFDPQIAQHGQMFPSFLSNLLGQLGQGANKGVGGVASAPLSAFGSLLASPLSGLAKSVEGTIQKKLIPREFGERKDPLHLIGTGAASAFGKSLGTIGGELLQDMASKAMAAAGAAGDQAARTAIINELKQTDPVLSQASDQDLMEAFHTMSRFAPTLSTDKSAVRSFLRQAVMSGAGPDYASIKLLADSERAVTGWKE